MVTIRIGNETRNYSDVTESWITDQVNRRRRDGQDVCVEVIVNTDNLNLRLTTPGCGGGGGGGRPPNGSEQELIELWGKRGLQSREFTGGNLVAFIKQLRSWLG